MLGAQKLLRICCCFTPLHRGTAHDQHVRACVWHKTRARMRLSSCSLFFSGSLDLKNAVSNSVPENIFQSKEQSCGRRL